MASPALRRRREQVVDQRSSNESAALRLIAAERPEEILPILLEEIVHLGFPRAAVLDVDFDTGEIKSVASLNCDNPFLEKFRTSLWASENPLVSILLSLKPAILPDGAIKPGALYAHPMIYRSQSRCWEAERERRSDCLAVQNADPKRKFQIQQQVCSVCGMRSYISLVIGQLGRGTTQSDIRHFRSLAERANRQLSRLFKVEHYYNRMRDMEITISRMTTVMESMADPVILTDNQHRVIIQNRAAEHFFRVPEGVSEGGKRAVEFNNLLFSAALSSMVVSGNDTSRDLTLVDVMEGEEDLFGPPGTTDPNIVKNEAKLDAYLTSFTYSFLERQNKALHLHSPSAGMEVEYAARSGKIYDARGQVAYTVTVLRDFSTWKKLEQLQMERRMLEMEKFAATGKLAGTIAHEINNPMEAIKNAIYLLKTRLDPESQPIYEVLRGETERVTRIVRQMLGLYRNAGQLGNFDLNAVVEDTLTLFGRPLTKAGVTVDKRLGALPPMKGSADQFRQLLSNLVVNAKDSMAEGGMLVVKTRHLRAPEGIHGWISITVADTGTGIPSDLKLSMFEPFVSTKGEKGTGLGLWIVKGIVENHTGRIQVRSTLGKGTVFKLDFPITH